MNPFRSVGARLGLGLAVVVAAALVLVDLIVVPSLEQNLIDSKIGQLEEAAPRVANQILKTSSFTLDDAMQSASESANARVVYFTPLNLEPPKLLVVADSNAVTSVDVENDPVALRALRSGRLVSGTVTARGQRYAEAGYYVLGGSVVLLRSSLHDSLRSIHLVRSRLVIAGLIALIASLLVGYLAATLFARRIRRLERAAERIADGDFSEPVNDKSKDELGQLAATFEGMRQRLAQLEHARREFIANASHELRTPLFSLGGFLELMTDEDLDPQTQAEFTATMREQVDRLTKLQRTYSTCRGSTPDGCAWSTSRWSSRASRRCSSRNSGRSRRRVATIWPSSARVRHRPWATRSVCSRSAGSSSRTRSFTPPRARLCDCGRHAGTARRCSQWRTGVRASRPSTPPTSSSASTVATARLPRAADSVLRSRRSSRS